MAYNIMIVYLAMVFCSYSTLTTWNLVEGFSTINNKTDTVSVSHTDNLIPNLDHIEHKREFGAIVTQKIVQRDMKKTNSTKLNFGGSLQFFGVKNRSNPKYKLTTVEYLQNEDLISSDLSESQVDGSRVRTYKHGMLSPLREGESKVGQNLFYDDEIWKDFGNHDDHFKCYPCNCSTTAHEKLHVKAVCQSNSMIDIPRNISNHLWSLDVFRTPMIYLNISRLLDYETLSEVNITLNKRLATINVHGGDTNRTSHVTKLLLTFNNITFIDDHSFSIFPSLQTLSLKCNNLKNIRNDTLGILLNLTSLDLSYNSLRFIESGAFNQLKRLRTLDLSYNYVMNYTIKYFPIALFEPLKNLVELSIQGHTKILDFQYPEDALSQLESLKSLTVDGLRTSFGHKMKSLKRLTHVTISSTGLSRHCHLETINSTFFMNVPYLRSIEIASCPLSYVDPLAYRSVSLTSLSLSYLAKYDLFQALDDIRGLQNSSLKNLTFIHLYHSSFPCRFLNKNHSRYLKNINLEVLDLSDNRLALLGEDFARQLPLTLQRLILRNNRFALSGLIVNEVNHLQELVEIDISIQNQFKYSLKEEDVYETPLDAKEVTCPQAFDNNDDMLSVSQIDLSAEPKVQTRETVTVIQYSSEHFVGGLENSSLELDDTHNTIFNDDDQLQTLQTHFQSKKIVFPPNLRFLKASQYYNFGLVLLQNPWSKTKLSELYFSKALLSHWGDGYIHNQITKIDLSKNYCKHINKKFFKANNSLVYLDIHNNALGADFAEDEEGAILAELSKLKYLDMSFNLIYKLPANFFNGLVALETLKVFENKLQVLNTTFSHMTRLRYLDLSRNSIVWISEKVRNDLDQIGEQLLVDLTLNPLPCTCAAIEFLNWMANTKVQLQNKDFLQCRLENGEIDFVGDLDQRVITLKRMCASKALVIVICVASLVVVGIMIGFGLIYKNRWKLRYLLNTAKSRLFGFKPKGEKNSKFKFDAFFIYTDLTRSFVLKDCIRELEEKRGHRLCVEDRDFMPGSPVIPGILSGVSNSHKTVPVIMPGFYSDGDFTEYSVKMALMEEIYERRQVLHLCIFEPTEQEEINNDLLAIMKRNSYTEYPPFDQATEHVIQSFWDTLSASIGHTTLNDDCTEPVETG